jgi:alkyl hydroperoxide reductase subunit AhpC
LKPEWDKRHVKPLGLSVDSGENHTGWASDIEETEGQALNFPVIADADRTVSNLYGMVHPEADPSITVRSVFIIDPHKKVRLILTYPPSTGRNFDEILRVIDSLQLTDAHKVATPVNWTNGKPDHCPVAVGCRCERALSRRLEDSQAISAGGRSA